MLKHQKYLPIFGLTLFLGFYFAPTTKAFFEFQSDDFYQMLADGIMIDSDNNAPGDLIIQFGSVVAQTLRWDATNSRFAFSSNLRIEGNLAAVGQAFIAADHLASVSDGILNLGRLSNVWQTLTLNSSTGRFDLSKSLNIAGGLEVTGNVDLNSNQLQEARLENLASAPTCNAGAEGRVYTNTTNNRSYVCDGTNFQNLEEKHYHNGTLTNDVVTGSWTGTTVAGGTTSLFLTSDGTSGGTKIFSTVYTVNATASTIGNNTNSPFLTGYTYNTSTGQLSLEFLESAALLGLGGQGLENAAAGTAFSVYVVGK